MLPTRDLNPPKTYPVINICLIAANVVAFTVFFQANLLHIFFNMWALLIFGNKVEERLGHKHYFQFYLTCGLMSRLAQMCLHTFSADPSIGATGAVAGVIAAYVALYQATAIRTLVLGPMPFDIPSWMVIGSWFIVQLVSGGNEVADKVGYITQVVGFASGIVLLGILSTQRPDLATPSAIVARVKSYSPYNLSRPAGRMVGALVLMVLLIDLGTSLHISGQKQKADLLAKVPTHISAPAHPVIAASNKSHKHHHTKGKRHQSH